MALKEGDIVKVKKGVLDPDFGNAIGGWKGEVSGVDGDLVCVEWDIIGSDDHYGILVKLRSGKNVYHYPLCIIRVKDKNQAITRW